MAITAVGMLLILASVCCRVFDVPIWGLASYSVLPAAVFYPVAAFAVLLIAIFLFRPSARSIDSTSSDTTSWTLGLVVAAAIAIGVWFASGGAFFWRNIFDGPIPLFGRLSGIVSAYSDLPVTEGIIDLWSKPTWIRLVSCASAFAYVLLLIPVARRLSGQSGQESHAFLFMALGGWLVAFASTGDFAVALLLFAVLSAIALAHFDRRVPIWQPLVLAAALVAFHSLFASILLSFLISALIPGSMAKSGLRRWSVPLAGAIAGAAVSLISQPPFVSIALGSRLADLSLFGTQVPGLVNQLLLMSGLLWFIALPTIVYAYFRWTDIDRKAFFISAWFFAGTAFATLSYSRYGLIVGVPSAVVSVFPAVLWLALFISKIERPASIKCFRSLTAANAFVAFSLLWAAGSSVGSANVFTKYASQEPAFNARFGDGRIGLLFGTGLTERIGAYNQALPVLEEFNSRFPADPNGRYEYGWALANAGPGKLVKGLEILGPLEKSLMDRNRLFWEFNYRYGVKLLYGHNNMMGSIALERAAADSATLEIVRYLALCYDDLRVWDSMGSKYEQVAALGDTSSDVIFKIADAAEKLGDSAKAFRYYNYGIERFPTELRNYEYPARYYFLNGKFDSLEALATSGLSHTIRSVELESCLLLIYHNTGRFAQRDSLFYEYTDYFQTVPYALYNWGSFLIDNGLDSLGRVAQDYDATAHWANLKSILDFYWYFVDNNIPDSAKSMIERVADSDTTAEILRVVDAVKRHNPEIWPEYKADSTQSK